MLPALPANLRTLSDVLPAAFQALAGQSNALELPAVEGVVVVLVDGLGHELVERHRGHARTLAGASREPLRTWFPSTTATSLSSLATGTAPGAHGVVGYEALVPGVGVRNMLSDWGADVPLEYQRQRPLWGAAECAIVHEARYARSGFTLATLTGARFLGENDAERRIALALATARRVPLTYLYLPELDRCGHQRGIASGEWIEVLEWVDGVASRLAAALPQHGILVTGDHGMIDVPHDDHVILDPMLVEQLSELGGEPRARHLYLRAPERADAVAALLRDRYAEDAWVATRAELAASGWLGDVDPEVSPRVGDIVLAARGATAFYADPASPSRAMVGQHGSLTSGETLVPRALLGAWAR